MTEQERDLQFALGTLPIEKRIQLALDTIKSSIEISPDTIPIHSAIQEWILQVEQRLTNVKEIWKKYVPETDINFCINTRTKEDWSDVYKRDYNGETDEPLKDLAKSIFDILFIDSVDLIDFISMYDNARDGGSPLSKNSPIDISIDS